MQESERQPWGGGNLPTGGKNAPGNGAPIPTLLTPFSHTSPKKGVKPGAPKESALNPGEGGRAPKGVFSGGKKLLAPQRVSPGVFNTPPQGVPSLSTREPHYSRHAVCEPPPQKKGGAPLQSLPAQVVTSAIRTAG